MQAISFCTKQEDGVRRDDWAILETDDEGHPQIFVVSDNYFVKNYEAVPGTMFPK